MKNELRIKKALQFYNCELICDNMVEYIDDESVDYIISSFPFDKIAFSVRIQNTDCTLEMWETDIDKYILAIFSNYTE